MKHTAKPFQATHYNPELIKDFSKVVCPPYDLIDKKKAVNLKKQSRYNYCRVSLADGDNYDLPAKNLKNWIAKKILIKDTKQSYYLYQQQFKVGKKNFLRYGVFCLLNMEKREIFPHEHTLSKPRRDRKKMIFKTKANLSPVFVIAGGADNFLTFLSKKYTKRKPIFQFKDEQQNFNRVWRVESQKELDLISSSLENSYLLIADGHHRFETSFDYFRKNRGKFKELNYILSCVTVAQPGLVILPTHRIVTFSGKKKEVFAQIEKYFYLSQVSQKLLEKKMKTKRRFSFGIYSDKKFYFASLKNTDILDKISPPEYRELDSYIFHKVVLPKLRHKNIEYSHNMDEAKKIAGNKKVVFFLKPASLESVLKIARAGCRLPQKSTYFYPKIPSGLVMRCFEK